MGLDCKFASGMERYLPVRQDVVELDPQPFELDSYQDVVELDVVELDSYQVHISSRLASQTQTITPRDQISCSGNPSLRRYGCLPKVSRLKAFLQVSRGST